MRAGQPLPASVSLLKIWASETYHRIGALLVAPPPAPVDVAIALAGVLGVAMVMNWLALLPQYFTFLSGV